MDVVLDSLTSDPRQAGVNMSLHEEAYMSGENNMSDILVAVTSTVGGATGGLAGTTSAQLELDRERANFLKFIFWGILGGVLAALGFLGNTLSMVVLQQRQMRSSTSYYLLSLAIYDNFILLGMTLYFILPALALYRPELDNYKSTFAYTIPVGYPLSLSAQMGSIYTCVGFTVERFIAVCRPLHVANTCTKSRTLKAILLIFIWAILYNIPRFFHYQLEYVTENVSPTSGVNNTSMETLTLALHSGGCDTTVPPDISSPWAYNNTGIRQPCVTAIDLPVRPTLNVMPGGQASVNALGNSLLTPVVRHDVIPDPTRPPSLTPDSAVPPSAAPAITPSSATPTTTTAARPEVRSVIRYEETPFGLDPTFQHIYLIYSHLFFMFLLPFVIILVMNIGLIRAVNKSKSMRQSMSASASKEHNLTVMLIAVIVVFLVCQFPTIVDNILVAVVGEKQLQKHYTYMCFYIVCTLMVEINAASNFLLYCFFGKKFRMTFLAILGLKRKQHHVAYRSTVCRSRTNGTRVYDMEVSVM